MIFLFALYGGLLLVAGMNLAFMSRPSRNGSPNFEAMVPARNEEENLPGLLKPLVSSGVPVTVFDDESTDGTASVCRELGAKVISAEGPLPPGWKGKTRACDQLAQAAEMEWVVFLDADTIPSAEFASTLGDFLRAQPERTKVVTGFPRMRPGYGLEPAYLGWVSWVLLATNPFALVSRTGRGHNRFTNGQFTAWRVETLREVRPFEAVKGEILEDVKIGRLLAKKGIRVEVANVSSILDVQMYRTLREAFDGMTKNSADIVGSLWGSLLLAAFFVTVAWAWVLGGPFALCLLGALVLSKALTDRIVGAPLWMAPLMPLTCMGAAVTIVRSSLRKRAGRIEWKGRIYDR